MKSNLQNAEKKPLMRALLRYRPLVVVVVALLAFAGLTMALRSDSDYSGIYPDAFWIQKARWEHCADVVLAGDSRTLCGLSPAEVGRYLPGLRIVNYGFNGTGFSGDYLHAIENLLSPGNRERIIVLGVTPLSLTPVAAGRNGFTENRGRAARFCVELYADGLLRWVDPMPLGELYRLLHPDAKRDRYYRDYHGDGWMASVKIPENQGEAIPLYRDKFKANVVSAALRENLVGQVARWTSQGIRVFAFRPPTCPEMVRLENTVSGYDEAAVRSAIEAAGGIWVPLDPSGYHSYDGSHLRQDAAVLLSLDMGLFIQADLQGKDTR